MYDRERRNNKIALIGFIVVILLLLGGGLFYYFSSNKENNTNIDVNVKERITPILYEVTKNGSDNKIYLFGSIHIFDVNKIEFPNKLIDAYNSSKYLAVEADIVSYMDNMNVEEYSKSFMYKDGTKLKDHVSKETYEKIVKFLKEYYYFDETLEMFNLEFIETVIADQILSIAKLKSNEGIDTYFLKKAKADNKQILEVESMEYQMSLSKKIPDKYYELSINNALDDVDKQVSDAKDLYKAWKKGDLESLSKLIEGDNTPNEKYTKEEIKIFEDYYKLMLTDRNSNMTNKLISYFEKNQNVFYMVGTAHLLGDKGIVQLLKDKGFNVVQVNY